MGRNYLLVVALGAGVMLAPLVSYAHTQQRFAGADTFAYDSRMKLSVKSTEPTHAEYEIQVMYHDGEDFPDNEWRTDYIDDLIRLAPGEVTDYTIEFKPSDKDRKLYVCTKLNRLKDQRITVGVRICSKVFVPSS